MTTWESIDNVDMENVTVTSDEAFERVTSDEGFIDEWEKWFLKQNTSWLVQEIPNISFLDIADTMLESKKTLYNKKNWNIVVWSAWKSVEAVPQDFANLRLWWDQSVSWPSTIHFDTWNITDDSEVMEYDDVHYRIKILKSWYYRISYWWTVDIWTATELLIAVMQNTDDIVWDNLRWISGTILSWWKTVSVSLNEWDLIAMAIAANSSISVLEKYTYLELKYVWESI